MELASPMSGRVLAASACCLFADASCLSAGNVCKHKNDNITIIRT